MNEPSADKANTDRPVMIEAEGLSKYYGDFAAVESVSFTVPRGQVAAFLGPNGAGKSTTMKLLTGYLAPSTGRRPHRRPQHGRLTVWPELDQVGVPAREWPALRRHDAAVAAGVLRRRPRA